MICMLPSLFKERLRLAETAPVHPLVPLTQLTLRHLFCTFGRLNTSVAEYVVSLC